MLVSTNVMAQYSATQPLLFLGSVHNQQYAAKNDFLRLRHEPSFCCHQQRLKPLKVNNDDESSEEKDYLTSTAERIAGLLAAPTPGIAPDLALGYPFLLATAFLFLPISTAALLLGFFAAFSFAGRKLILEDYLEEQNDVTMSDADEEADLPPTNLLALGSSVLSSALFTPATDSNSSLLNLDAISPVGVILILAVFSSFLVLGAGNEQKTAKASSSERKLMEIWDDQLSKQTSYKAQKNK